MDEFEIENAKPYQRGDGEAVMLMQGIVGDDGPITTKMMHRVEQWAAERGVKRMVMRMNSEGGDPAEAMAVCDIIKQSGLEYECDIYGMCASAATLIALSCKKVRMSASSQFMVHHPFGFITGELEDLEAGVEKFRTVREQAFSIYAQKTGKTVEQLMAEHTHAKWYTAQEALDYGFIDEIIVPNKEDPEDFVEDDPRDAVKVEEEKTVIEQRYNQRGLMSGRTFQRIAASFGFKLGVSDEDAGKKDLKRMTEHQREVIARLKAERDGAHEAARKASAEAQMLSQNMDEEVAARVAKREAEIRAEMGVLPGDLPKPDTLGTPEKLNFKGKTLGEMMRMAHDAQ